MNLHRVIYTPVPTEGPDQDGLDRQEFFASAGDASKRRTELKKANLCIGKPEQEAIDVPTTKTELLAWLNKNATIQQAN